MTHKKSFLAGLIALLLVIFAIVGIKQSASASADDNECVPHEAYTETIEHPAVTRLVHHEAVTEDVTVVDSDAVPPIWANFSPNNNREPFEGPPGYPTDARGTWHNHDNIPGGHEGPDGVYQRDHPGQGNADWFFRQNARDAVTHVEQRVITDAYDETVVDIEAWTETIEHPAVTCDGEQPDPVISVAELSSYKCGDAYETWTTVTTTAEYVLVDHEWVLGTPVSVSEDVKVPVKVTPCAEEPEQPPIEQPGPGEEITYQSFDSDGNLVEQRVSKPIPAHAEQEGM